MQVQKFTAFMQPLISRAPVCRPEGHRSSPGQPHSDLPLISSRFEILELQGLQRKTQLTLSSQM